MRRDAAAQAAADLVVSATLAAVLVTGLSPGGPRLSAPGLVLAAMLTLGLFELVAPLPAAYRSWTEARAARRRLEELVSVPEHHRIAEPFPVGRSLRLECVSAGYGDATAVTINELTVPPGALVVLRGPSGSGKSTLLRVMAGALEPREGRVLVGNTPLPQIDPVDLTRHITLVDQDSHLFDGTVADNLRLARPDASDEELNAVLAVVVLDALVAETLRGLATPIGEHGAALSGGQRRRLSVAQALLRRPDILLLDEPTEGLDNATACRMLTAIRAHLPGATLVIAAHERALRHLPDGMPYEEVAVTGRSAVAESQAVAQHDPARTARTARKCDSGIWPAAPRDR
jgi:ATP-binding cassette subfamily C protein CydC